MYLSTQLVTPPAAEAVSLSQAKSQLRVDFDDDDALIEGLISAARQYAEKRTRRSFFNTTYKRTLDHFPTLTHFQASRTPQQRETWPYSTWMWDALTIQLPYGPAQSVESITYIDSYGESQTLSPSAYNVDTTSVPARITPVQGTVWPIVTNYKPGSVVITFVSGSYGDGVEVNTIPQALVQAILLLITHWYQNREGVSPIALKTVPTSADALLDMWKVSTGVTR